MYNDCNEENKVGYTTFREIFEGNFNIAFDFPPKYTCSTCDTLKANIAATEQKISSSLKGEEYNALMKTLQNLEKEKKLYLLKSEKFYSLKKKFRKKARKKEEIEAIAMNYQKNLPTPNISTNDVYYRRLSLTSYLLTSTFYPTQSLFFTHTMREFARKGADDVCSMLCHFFTNVLDTKVRQLIVFCDSCAGQNKNYTVLHFLHYMVHQLERFETVKIVFPIRGHSYLECDKNMSLVNTKSYVEVPAEWRDVLRNNRIKPSFFKVIDCAEEVSFQNWIEYLAQFYVPK